MVGNDDTTTPDVIVTEVNSNQRKNLDVPFGCPSDRCRQVLKKNELN